MTDTWDDDADVELDDLELDDDDEDEDEDGGLWDEPDEGSDEL